MLTTDKEHARSKLEDIEGLFDAFFHSMPIYDTPQGEYFLPYVTRLYGSIICIFCPEFYFTYRSDDNIRQRFSTCYTILDDSYNTTKFDSSVNFDRDQSYFENCSSILQRCLYQKETNLSGSCQNNLRFAYSKLNNEGTGIKMHSVQTELATLQSNIEVHDKIISEMGLTKDEVACVVYLRDSLQAMKIVMDVLTLLNYYKLSTSLGEHSHIAGLIFGIMSHGHMILFSQYPDHVPGYACTWYYRIEEATDRPNLTYCRACDERINLFKDLTAAIDKYQALGYSFITLGKSISTAHTTMRKIEPNLKNVVLQYLNQSITKHTLGEVMETISGRQALSLVASEGTTFLSTGLQSMEDAAMIIHKLKKIYNNRFVLTFPLYNISSFPFTQFLTYMIDYRPEESTTITEMLNSLKVSQANVSQRLDEVFTLVFKEYRDIVRNVATELSIKLERLLKAEENYRKRLDAFQQAEGMNNEFYM